MHERVAKECAYRLFGSRDLSERFSGMHGASVSLNRLAPPLMLLASNVFMTFAWYGHLRYRSAPLVLAIGASWGIALFEYCIAVPANRMGAGVYSAAELKTMQEVITLVVFAIFSVVWLRQPLTWSQMGGFALIGLGAVLIFLRL